MNAWLLPKIGSIDNLTLGDAPAPTAAAGEVVLRLSLAALNPADRYLAEGMYPSRPPLPHVLGRDGLGVVDSVGPDVTGWTVGDTAVIVRCGVGVTRAGTFAEQVAVPAESLVRVPDGWTHEQAAGASLVYLTAWQALTQWGNLPPASVVLVTGASGGVGVATLQLARSLGHLPVGLSRGTGKIETLKRLGAEHVLDPNDSQWTRKLNAAVDDRPVALAVDNIGGPAFNDLLRTLGDGGRVSVVGRLAGPVPQFNTADLFFRRLKIGGVSAGSYTPTAAQNAWAGIVDRLDAAGQRPQVDRVFPFAELPAAFEHLAAGPIGKVLLSVPR